MVGCRQSRADHDTVGPVTSQLIVDLFSARGYQLQGRYNAPLIYSAGELVVLSRSDLTGA